MEQKVIITKNENTINDLIKEGWKVTHLGSQSVSAAQYSSGMYGNFCFVLEREIRETIGKGDI